MSQLPVEEIAREIIDSVDFYVPLKNREELAPRIAAALSAERGRCAAIDAGEEMSQRPTEEVAREIIELVDFYVPLKNREELAPRIVAALDAERARFQETIDNLGQEVAMLQSRERKMVEDFWDQDSVECGNCGLQIVARGGTFVGNNGLSEAEGEDLSLCGHCMDLEAATMLREQLDAERARCAELEKACRAFVEAWDKSHQLEKTDIAYRTAKAARLLGRRC